MLIISLICTLFIVVLSSSGVVIKYVGDLFGLVFAEKQRV